MKTPIRSETAARAGFTMIELLTVLMIIAILSYILVVNVGSARDTVEAGNTRNLIGQLELALGEYADEYGDYPLSIFTPEQGTPPNNLNLGSECLYLALCGEGGKGEGRFDDRLENLDGDKLSRRVPGFATLELFEIVDDWGNPIVYLHNRYYDSQDLYTSIDEDAVELETVVRARQNVKTKRFQKPRSFQLISAGVDGTFGTEDDVCNFQD